MARGVALLPEGEREAFGQCWRLPARSGHGVHDGLRIIELCEDGCTVEPHAGRECIDGLAVLAIGGERGLGVISTLGVVADVVGVLSDVEEGEHDVSRRGPAHPGHVLAVCDVYVPCDVATEGIPADAVLAGHGANAHRPGEKDLLQLGALRGATDGALRDG